MFLEKDKAAKSTEPVNSGTTDASAGEPLLTGASTPAIIKRDGPALPNTQIKEIDDKQDNNSNPDEEGSNDENECSDEDELSGEDEGSDEDGSTDSEYSENEGNYVPNLEFEIWKRRYEKWSDKKWLKYEQIVRRSGIDHMRRLKRNSYFQRWLRNNLNENEQDEERDTPPDGDESASDSLNVTSSSLAAMDVAEMDKSVQDAVLPARYVKVPAKMVQKSLDSEGYVQVARRRLRNRRHADPNACKSS